MRSASPAGTADEAWPLREETIPNLADDVPKLIVGDSSVPDLPKTAAEYDRQLVARAVCFTAVLATGRKRERYEFKCDTAAERYNQFLAAVSQAKGLRDAYGRRGLVYAVDTAGRDVHLAEAFWPEVMTVLRHAAKPPVAQAARSPTHSHAHQPQQTEKQMPKAKTRRVSKRTKKTATKPGKAPATAQPPGHAYRPLKTAGVIYRIKKLILENPGITAADLTAKLVADGFTPSQATIASFRTDFVHSLRVLKSCGYDIPGVQA